MPPACSRGVNAKTLRRAPRLSLRAASLAGTPSVYQASRVEIEIASDQLSVLVRQALRDSFQVGREPAKHAAPPLRRLHGCVLLEVRRQRANVNPRRLRPDLRITVQRKRSWPGRTPRRCRCIARPWDRRRRVAAKGSDRHWLPSLSQGARSERFPPPPIAQEP